MYMNLYLSFLSSLLFGVAQTVETLHA